MLDPVDDVDYLHPDINPEALERLPTHFKKRKRKLEQKQEESESDEERDSDRELQEALAQGLIEPGTYVAQKAPRPRINNVYGLQAKLREFSRSTALPWIERLAVTADRPQYERSALDKREDDFHREASFIAQAEASISSAVPRLHSKGVATKRPGDYYAEQAKTDKHMARVRSNLIEMQQRLHRRDKARALREQRKFAVAVQRDVQEERRKDKRELDKAVKKHRKGMRGQLDELLHSNPKKRGMGPAAARRKREYKDEKYGMGGKKGGRKRNTAASAAGLPEKGAKKSFAAAAKGAKHRPGKASRNRKKAKTGNKR